MSSRRPSRLLFEQTNGRANKLIRHAVFAHQEKIARALFYGRQTSARPLPAALLIKINTYSVPESAIAICVPAPG
jgi:hypothetical protein